MHSKDVDSGREGAFAERGEAEQSRQEYCISHGGTQQLQVLFAVLLAYACKKNPAVTCVYVHHSVMFRQRAAEMEEELEKTKQSYQTQISAHEKKAHNNWVSNPLTMSDGL